MTLEAMEREAIEAALVRHGGNLTQSAAELGISLSTIRRKRRLYLRLDSLLQFEGLKSNGTPPQNIASEHS